LIHFGESIETFSELIQNSDSATLLCHNLVPKHFTQWF